MKKKLNNSKDGIHRGYNMKQVIHNLWIGDCSHATDIGLLKEIGITMVMNVGYSLKPDITKYSAEGIRYFKIGLKDDTTNSKQLVRFAVKALKSFVTHGERTLIHCAAGLSRSPFIVALYIMETHDCDLDGAYKILKEVYPQADEESPMKFTKGLFK